LGGYGVPAQFADDTLVVTREQRLIASQFIVNPKLMLYQRTASESEFQIAMNRKVKIKTREWFLKEEEVNKYLRVARRTGILNRDPSESDNSESGDDDDEAYLSALDSDDDVEQYHDVAETWADTEIVPMASAALRPLNWMERLLRRKMLIRLAEAVLVPFETDALALREMVMRRARFFSRADESPESVNPLFLLTSRRLMRRFGRVVPIIPASDAELLRWWDPVALTVNSGTRLPPLTTLRDRLANGHDESTSSDEMSECSDCSWDGCDSRVAHLAHTEC
jgi:hypothetical protein